MVHLKGMTVLDAFMKAEKITDAEFAKMVGRERSTITKLRLGQTKPSLELALRIANVSHGRVSPGDLMPAETPT